MNLLGQAYKRLLAIDKTAARRELAFFRWLAKRWRYDY